MATCQNHPYGDSRTEIRRSFCVVAKPIRQQKWQLCEPAACSKNAAWPCMLFVGGLITGTQSWHTPKKCSRGPQRRVVSYCVSYLFLCTPVGSSNLFVVVDIIPKTCEHCLVSFPSKLTQRLCSVFWEWLITTSSG